MLGTGKQAICSQCHEEVSAAYQVGLKMKKETTNFKNKIELADSLLTKAYKEDVDVSEPQFKLREANNLLVMIRDLTHSLSVETVEEKSKRDTKSFLNYSKSPSCYKRSQIKKNRANSFFSFCLYPGGWLFLKYDK